MSKRQKSATAAGPLSLAAGIACIFILVFIDYYPAIRGQFIWDDYLYVANCDLIKAHDGLYRFWFTTQPIDYWPVSNSSFWIEWRLWGTNTLGYHLTNIVLHGISALLVWLILRKLSIPGAFLAALLFAVHPVNIESVAWIAQRKGLMALCFALLSILCYLQPEPMGARLAGEKQTTWRSYHWYAASWLCFLLAMLSKGSVALLPLVLVLIVWWKRRAIGLTDLVRIIPFLLLAAALTLVNIWFQQKSAGGVVRNAGLCERIADSGVVVWFYLSKALLPIDLAFIYPQPKVDPATAEAWIPLAGAIAATCALFWKRHTRAGRHLLFAWAFFCLALLPVMGLTDVYFMKFSLVADHYQYLAVIAVAAAATASWTIWLRRTARAWRPVAFVGAAAVIGAFGLLTWQQSHLYSNAAMIYQATLEKNPSCWLAHNNLGRIFFDAGRLKEAIEQYEEALSLKDNFPETHNNLSAALLKTGKLPEAIEHLHIALELDPGYAEAHTNLGIALSAEGRLPEAIEQHRLALATQPDNPEFLNNLGAELSKLGRYQETIDCFEKALRINPDYPDAHNNLGIEIAARNQWHEAIAQYEEAIRLKPSYPEAHYNLARAMFETGRPQEAIAQYRLALRYRPSYVEAYNNLGKVFMEISEPQEALEQYQQALRLKPGEEAAYLNLMKAYSVLDRSTEAIDTAEKALDLARAQGKTELVRQIAEWLADYRRRLVNPEAPRH